MAEIFSIAIFELVEGQDDEALATIRELLSSLTAKGYSRDSVYRQTVAPCHYVLLRHWRSEGDRGAALEDPELQRIWARLGNLISIVGVYETLELVA
jgi:hypothetical protein